jgi:hypothetical protein
MPATSLSPCRDDKGIGGRRNVVRRDVALGKPAFVCGVKRRNEAAAGLENVGVAADGV